MTTIYISDDLICIVAVTLAMVRMVLQVHQDYLENQEYQATPDCLVLSLLGKLGLLVRTVRGANLGQKLLSFD